MKSKRRGKVVVSVLLALALMFSNISPISLIHSSTDEVKAADTITDPVDLGALREITWSDFGVDTSSAALDGYEKVLMNEDGNTGASMNNTIFNGDVSFGYGTKTDSTKVGGELRYGSSYFGLAFKLTDAGALNIGAAYYDFSNADIPGDYTPAQFGMTSETFEGQNVNLKIAIVDMAEDLSSARIGIWINNIMMGGEFFTLTLQSNHLDDGSEFSHSFVLNDSGIVDPNASTMDLPVGFPTDLKELSWSNYGVTDTLVGSNNAKVRFEMKATPSADDLDYLKIRFYNSATNVTDIGDATDYIEKTFTTKDEWESVEIELNKLVDNNQFAGLGFAVFGGPDSWNSEGTYRTYGLSFRNMAVVDGDTTHTISLDSSNLTWTAGGANTGLGTNNGTNNIGTDAAYSNGEVAINGIIKYGSRKMTFTNPIKTGVQVTGYVENTYETGVSDTIFNADVAFNTSADFRYGCHWNGLTFILNADNGSLTIKQDGYVWSGTPIDSGALYNNQQHLPKEFGLETFKDTRVNLKIAIKDVNAERTTATVGIWINNKMVGGDYFTIASTEKATKINGTMLRSNLYMYAPSLGMPYVNSTIDYTYINWKDFGVKTGSAYTKTDNSWAYAEYAAATTLNNTIFEDKIVFAQNSGIRYGGSSKYYGLHIKVEDSGQLCLSSDTFYLTELEGVVDNQVLVDPGDFELDSFVGTELTLKIAFSNISSDGASGTVGVWVNGIPVDESFTMTTKDSTNHFLGNKVCLYDGAFSQEGTIVIPQPELTKITWADFTDAEYGKTYTTSDYRVVYTGTSLNNTLFEDYIVFTAGAQIRYATCDEWQGLNIEVTAGGKLRLYSDVLHFKNPDSTTYDENVVYDADQFGLTTLAGKKILLSIEMRNVTTTSADVTVCINGIQVTDKLTITSEDGTDKLGNIVNMALGGSNTIPVTVPVPTNLTPITWEDFGITGGVTYNSSVSRNEYGTAFHLADLNDTLFDGDIMMAAGSQFRYGGAQDTWTGMYIEVRSDEKLKLYSNEFEFSKDNDGEDGIVIDNPTYYGLNSFANKRFNLKIAMTDVSETQATVSVWVNDEIVYNTFTMTANTGSAWKLGNGMVIKAAGDVTPYSLKNSAPTGLTKVKLGDWKETVYDDKKWSPKDYLGGAIQKDGISTLIGTSWVETIEFVGPTDNSWETYYICYGGTTSNSWAGLRIALSGENMILYGASTTFTDEWTLNAKTAGVTSFVGTEYQLQIDTVALGEHVLVYISFDGELYNNAPFVLYNYADEMSNAIESNFNPNGTATYAIVGSTKELTDLYHNLAEGAYKVPTELDKMQQKSIDAEGGESWTDVTVEGGSTMNVAGDYKIEYSDGVSNYSQEVILYNAGDAKFDVNNNINAADLVRELKYINNNVDKGEYKCEQRGYDVDGNFIIDTADVDVLRDILLDIYEPENEANIMPIIGYYGPIGDSVNDNMYKLLREAGINTITQYENQFTDNASERYYVYQQLTLAQKYGMDITVQDYRLSVDPSSVTQTAVQNAIVPYKNFQSFEGLYIVDEPYSATNYPLGSVARSIDTYSALGQAASAEGVFAYGNLHPFWWSNGKGSWDYYSYINEYIDEMKAPYVSFDYYPFWSCNIDKGYIGDGVEDASQFFENLAMVRYAANKNSIPFRTFIQTGDGFEATNGTLEANTPSEGEFKWQTNISLAFGAKGIQYFPAVQPDGFLDLNDSTVSSGLLDKDGNKSEWYDYAVDTNKQIAAIDEVLMNATNEGFMSTGGYAQSQATSVVDSMTLKKVSYSYNWFGEKRYVYKDVETIDTAEIYSNDTGYYGAKVTSSDSTYGAFTGCFKYGDKHALYIVNYNVNEGTTNTVTVNFGSSVSATTILNAVTEAKTGTSMDFKLAPGEAVLVVY